MGLSRIALGLGLVVLAGAVGGEAVFAQADPPKQPSQSFGPRAQKGQVQRGQRAQRGPPPEIVATFDDWKIQCETVRLPAAGQKPASGESEAAPSETATAPTDAGKAQTRRICGMVQSAQDEKRPQLGLTLYISRIRQGDKMLTQMRVMAPIGVWLPQGVGLDIDGQAVGSMPYSNCLPQVCLARAETSPETLDKFKKGSVANFFIYAGPGAGVPLKISLKGFGKALEALDQL